MNKLIIPSLAAFVIATAGLAACQNKSNQNAPETPPPGPAQPMQQGANQNQMGQGTATMGMSAPPAAASMNAGAQQSVIDTSITAKVKSALAANSRLKSSALQVSTQNGVVTLSGTVKSQSQKTLAASLASQVTGVSSVTNNIQVSGK